MSDELDPGDKALLRDIQAFNRTYAASGWHLQDKVVTEDLSGIALVRSSMTSVQFLHVHWRNAILTNTQFTNVEFQQSDFTGATFHDVVFKDCKFKICSFARARLNDCRFVNCTSEELNARDATFEACGFESFEDNSGVFGSAAFHKCRYERGRMDNSSFYSSKFTDFSVKQTACENVSFADIEGTNLLFEDAAIHNCSFTGGHYGKVAFERGQSKGLTFKEFHPQEIAIQNCEKIEALSVLNSMWSSPTIAACPAIFELTIDESRIEDLTISHSRIAYFEMEETQISGNSRISDCEISGLNLEKSTLTGTHMINCVLAKYLMASGATLDGVVLSGITYAPGLEISASDAKYLNGSPQFGVR